MPWLYYVAPLDDINPAWVKALLSGREPRWSHFLWNIPWHEAFISASTGFAAAVLVSAHLLEFEGLQNSYLSWAP